MNARRARHRTSPEPASRFVSIDGVEHCDDGNLIDDDGCDSSCLIEVPTTCEAASGCIALGAEGRSKLKISNSSEPAKDKLLWKWTKGLETEPTDLGDPLTATAYTLCLYDSGNVVGSYEVPSSDTLWTSSSSGTLVYRDKPGTEAGVTSIKLRPGADGKARVDTKAAGTSLLLPTPVSGTQLFTQSPSITVRLVNSDGTCWEADFPAAAAKKNTPEQFQASVP
jgi:cysteine-rich repeat protein